MAMAAQDRRQIAILTSARFVGNFVFSFDTISPPANTPSLAGWNQTKAGSLSESKGILGWQACASARHRRTLPTECDDNQERGGR
jgi:hypothetical protein